MAHDLYADARSTGLALRDAGHATWSSRLDDMLLAGATPTEILTGLRSVLDSLLETQLGFTPGPVRQARETRAAVDAALR